VNQSGLSRKHLGETIDIHAGGQDLVFPHHENELAQSTCAHDGAIFARYWLHNGFLSIKDTKMSKSLGNVLLVHELIKTIPGEVIRLALLSAHYRQPLDWSDETLESSRRMLDRLYGAIRGIDVPQDLLAKTAVPADVLAALDDDLNTPKAMAELFSLARELNRSSDLLQKQKLAAAIRVAGDLLGLLQDNPDEWFAGEGSMLAEEIESLIEERNEARALKDFATADRVRDKLAAAGITIEDGADGTRWRRN
jgi:cysteinyl-tRNA synthetase